ncbi:MAG: pyrimidine dimer DNA glycosylase/endonuclease V [Candidatus Bathyarchaeia archaeon]
MRLWLIHPKYLDCRGLVAVWREGLLAKKVLEGKTMGYRKHPQLKIFEEHERPVALINAYLFQIYLEAKRRGCSFDSTKNRMFELERSCNYYQKAIEGRFSVINGKTSNTRQEKV